MATMTEKYISGKAPVGHCDRCGEALVMEPCPNCGARRQMDE